MKQSILIALAILLCTNFVTAQTNPPSEKEQVRIENNLIREGYPSRAQIEEVAMIGGYPAKVTAWYLPLSEKMKVIAGNTDAQITVGEQSIHHIASSTCMPYIGTYVEQRDGEFYISIFYGENQQTGILIVIGAKGTFDGRIPANPTLPAEVWSVRCGTYHYAKQF